MSKNSNERSNYTKPISPTVNEDIVLDDISESSYSTPTMAQPMIDPKEFAALLAQAMVTVQALAGTPRLHPDKRPAPSSYDGRRDANVLDGWLIAFECYGSLTSQPEDKMVIYACTLLTGQADQWVRRQTQTWPSATNFVAVIQASLDRCF